MGFNFDKSSQGGDGGGGGKVRRTKSVGYWLAPLYRQTNPYWRLTDPGAHSLFFAIDAFSTGIGTPDASVSAYSTYTYSFSLTSSQWMEVLAFGTSNLDSPYSLYATYLNINGDTLTSSQIPVAGHNGGPGGNYNELDIYGYGNTVTVRWYNNASFEQQVRIGTVVPDTIISPSGSIQWPPALSGKYVYRDSIG